MELKNRLYTQKAKIKTKKPKDVKLQSKHKFLKKMSEKEGELFDETGSVTKSVQCNNVRCSIYFQASF